MDSLTITSEMMDMFHYCTHRKNYQLFWFTYQKTIERCAQDLRDFEIPNSNRCNFIIKNIAKFFNYWNCWRQSVSEELINVLFGVEMEDMEMVEDIITAVDSKDWEPFYKKYWKHLDLIINKARQEGVLSIYIEYKEELYPDLASRDLAMQPQNYSCIMPKGISPARPRNWLSISFKDLSYPTVPLLEDTFSDSDTVSLLESDHHNSSLSGVSDASEEESFYDASESIGEEFENDYDLSMFTDSCFDLSEFRHTEVTLPEPVIYAEEQYDEVASEHEDVNQDDNNDTLLDNSTTELDQIQLFEQDMNAIIIEEPYAMSQFSMYDSSYEESEENQEDVEITQDENDDDELQDRVRENSDNVPVLPDVVQVVQNTEEGDDDDEIRQLEEEFQRKLQEQQERHARELEELKEKRRSRHLL